MSELNVGSKAPDFKLPCDGSGELSLSDYKGKKVILYFYPKDNTPGCTKQACGFRDQMKGLDKQGVAVVGVSKDTVLKHDKFKDKYELNFPLISDEQGSLCEAYGVWVEKSLYGKKYMGIERSTFLIDEQGKIAKIWRKVRVKGHVEEVVDTVKALKQAA